MSLYPADPLLIVEHYNSQPYNLAHYINSNSKQTRKPLSLEQFLNKNGMSRDVIIDEYRWKKMNDEEARKRLFENLQHITQQNQKRKRKQMDSLNESQKNLLREQALKRYYDSGKQRLQDLKEDDPEAFNEKKSKQWNDWYQSLSKTQLDKMRKDDKERKRIKRNKQ